MAVIFKWSRMGTHVDTNAAAATERKLGMAADVRQPCVDRCPELPVVRDFLRMERRRYQSGNAQHPPGE